MAKAGAEASIQPWKLAIPARSVISKNAAESEGLSAGRVRQVRSTIDRLPKVSVLPVRPLRLVARAVTLSSTRKSKLPAGNQSAPRLGAAAG